MEEPSLSQRLKSVAALMPLLIGVPLAAGAVVSGQSGVTAAALGSLFTILLVVKCGTRVALRTLPILVVALVLGSLTVGSWIWVLLLATIGAATGYASSKGGLVSLALAGMVASWAPPIDPTEGLMLRVVIFTTAGLYVTLVASRLGLPDHVPAPRTTVAAAIPIAIVLGAAAAIAATIALRWDETYAYWIPLTVFLLATPTRGLRINHGAVHRILGTTVGLVCALPLHIITAPAAMRILLPVLIVVLLLFVLALPTPLWLNAALSTALVVLLFDAPGGMVHAGRMRLLDVAIAAGIVLVGVAVLTWWARYREHHDLVQALSHDGTTPTR